MTLIQRFGSALNLNIYFHLLVLDGVYDVTVGEPRLRCLAQLRVWNTERNNGVLIYLLLADRDIEIVADRGVDGRIEAPEWEEVCRCMEHEFRAGRFEAGAIAGVHRVSAIIARHFPAEPGDRNELPDAQVLIG